MKFSRMAWWMTLPTLLPLLFGVVGCATHKALPPAALPWSASEIAAIDRFAIKGKVGFRRGETGGSAALIWRQENDRYQLSAVGPLGQGATRISGHANLIRIENSAGTQESSAPETLLAEALGWPVSVNSLAFWVRGLPAPGSDATVTVDESGQPSHIRQQDWDIVLDRYRPDAGRMLPHRVVATGGDSRITLLIERWDIPAPTSAPVLRLVTPSAAPPTPQLQPQ